jgi:hypothetical protein
MGYNMLKNQVREQEHAAEIVRAIQLAKLIFTRCLGELQLRKRAQDNEDYIADNH